MRWLAAFIVTLLTAIALPALSAESSASTEAAWKTIAKLSFPRETRVSFRETRSSKLLRTPAQQTGALWIEHSGDFVMQVMTPRRELRRLSQKRLTLIRGKKQRSVTLNPDKGAHQLLLSIMDVLEGNVPKLQERFTIEQWNVTQTNRGDSWAVALAPIDSGLRKGIQRLLVRGRGQALLSLRTERSASSWQELVILSTPLASLNDTAAPKND